MTLTLITHPATEPLTLAEAKAHCRVEYVIDDTLTTALIPDIGTYYRLPVSGLDVLDVLVPDDWDTDGTVLSSSDNFDEDGYPILLAEPFIHHYAGWEV